MRRLIKNWDLNGKPITFYYMTSSIHKTIFGGLLSIFSFSLMLIITITSLIDFLYQKPTINSNVVFYINKKFMYLENMEINGSLHPDHPNALEQLDEFMNYFRIAFYEKNEFDSIDNLRVAKLDKNPLDNSYKFSFHVPISDVFKDKEFSVLKIMSCKELNSYEFTVWEDKNDKKSCNENYQEYFKTNLNKKNFMFSFNTPIYSIDRKGHLQKTNHENEFAFTVTENKSSSFSMETKFVVIEDNSSLVFSTKHYESYVVLKNPKLSINEHDFDGFSLEMELVNNSSEEIILITIYKYKLLDFFAKLGGIMKIITFMKMTCRFWTSYLYEKSLYNLVVSRKNKYLEEKKAMIESSYYLNPSKQIEQINVQVVKDPTRKKIPTTNYTSYCVWFANRFCKCFYLNKEAKQKRKMLCEILGLENYLLHMDYIDRQIMLEHHDQRIGRAINRRGDDGEGNEDRHIPGNASNISDEQQLTQGNVTSNLINAPENFIELTEKD